MRIHPSFFIVGAPKAGTTALHAYLAQHPEVCMSSIKEPNYFSHQEIVAQPLYYRHKNITDEKSYLDLFECKKDARIAGEASVSYLYYPGVAARIRTFNPQSKIIISLRNPVERAVSHYQMDFSLGLVPFSFDVIISNGENHPATGIYYQQYVLLGDYVRQVERYLQQFPREQVLLVKFEELKQQPEDILAALSAFLGIRDQHEVNQLEEVNVTGTSSSPIIRSLYQSSGIRQISNAVLSKRVKNYLRKSLFSKSALPVPNPETLALLKQKYTGMPERLSTLTGMDFNSWK